jgi:hypothetical protein
MLAWGIAVIAASSLFALTVVQRQFGGYDLSILIDLTWRFKQGQAPGVDFIATLPMSEMAVAKVLSWFQPAWLGLTYANVAITALAWVLLWLHGPVFYRNRYLAVLAPLVLVVPLLYTNHFWHSSLAQLLACLLVFSSYAAVTQTDRRRLVLLALSAGLFVGAKQNVAPLVLGVTFGWLIATGPRAHRAVIAALLGGSAAGVAGYLLLLRMDLSTFLYSYTSVGGRLLPDPSMAQAIFALPSTQLLVPVAAAGGVLIVVLVAWGRLPRTVRVYLAACFAVSLVPFGTDWDAKLNNLPLPMFILVMLASPYGRSAADLFAARASERVRRVATRPLGAVAASVVVSVVLVATWGGWGRERMQAVGPFYEPTVSNVVRGGYFDGLGTGPWFATVLSEIEAVGRSSTGQRVFYGPRIEFGYQVTGASSPTGLPIWWHPGSSYAVADTDAITRRFVQDRFDLLVFSRGDRTRVPSQILDYITAKYELVPGFYALDVYRRRGSS